MKRASREAGFSLIEALTVTAVMAAVLLVVAQMADRMQIGYLAQRRQLEALDNARPALDLIVRLARMAGGNPRGVPGVRAIDPDPDGNGALDSIALQADWNPPNGSFADPWENVAFSVRDNALVKVEAGDPPEGVLLGPGVAALRFAYLDAGLAWVADPIATPEAIAYVSVTLILRDAAPHAPPPIELGSGTAVRGRE
jgi:type II secretory pathway component PulJ